MPVIPKSFPPRLELVGTTLYGRWWARPLAAALGVSEVKLMRWRQGVRPLQPVDDQLVDVLARRGFKDAGALQAVEDLERSMARFVRTQVL